MDLINGRMVHACAPNDRNGNPRRLYVGFFENQGIQTTLVWDEGYSGHHAVPERYREAAYHAERVEISPAEYRRALKSYGR